MALFDKYQRKIPVVARTLLKKFRDRMDTTLWICQLLLATIFGYSGLMKSSQNREYLVSIGQTGVDGLAYPLIRFIGITETLGAIGILVPWAIKILPILTPITGACFALIMILAAPIHFKRKEYKSVGLNVSIFLMSAFVAYGRLVALTNN